MKKILYIFIAITAFLMGVGAFYWRPLINFVPLYDVTQNAGLYKFQKIHIKGYLEARNFDYVESKEEEIYIDLFDYKKSCIKDCITGATLHLPERLDKNSEIYRTIKELVKRNKEPRESNGTYFIEVEILGEIEEIDSCFGLPYIIKADEIKQISPIQYMSAAEFAEITHIKNIEQ